MGEFASKGMAGTGLGLSIAGLSAALLSNSNNGGLTSEDVRTLEKAWCAITAAKPFA